MDQILDLVTGLRFGSNVAGVFSVINDPSRLPNVSFDRSTARSRSANNHTARYAQALLAATRQEDLAQPDRPKKFAV